MKEILGLFSSSLWNIVGGGAIGGLIGNELNRRFGARRELRQHLGRALADLLEIRHGMEALDLTVIKIGQKFSLSDPRLRPIVNSVLETLVPTGPQHQRYDLAISAVAGFDPLLAFELRSKNLGSKLMDQLSSLAMQDGTTQKVWDEAEPLLSKSVKQSLTRAVLLLARKHGLITWVKLRWRLARPRPIPVEADAFLDTMAKAVLRHAPVGAAAAPVGSAVR